MLETLRAYGHVIGDLDKVEKLIPHKYKCVLLRFFYDWQDSNDAYYEDRFLNKWLPVREYIESKTIKIKYQCKQ